MITSCDGNPSGSHSAFMIKVRKFCFFLLLFLWLSTWSTRFFHPPLSPFFIPTSGTDLGRLKVDYYHSPPPSSHLKELGLVFALPGANWNLLSLLLFLFFAPKQGASTVHAYDIATHKIHNEISLPV